ncbi:hypothetical protein DaDZ19_42800 [Dickeya ananatis]
MAFQAGNRCVVRPDMITSAFFCDDVRIITANRTSDTPFTALFCLTHVDRIASLCLNKIQRMFAITWKPKINDNTNP